MERFGQERGLSRIGVELSSASFLGAGLGWRAAHFPGRACPRTDLAQPERLKIVRASQITRPVPNVLTPAWTLVRDIPGLAYRRSRSQRRRASLPPVWAGEHLNAVVLASFWAIVFREARLYSCFEQAPTPRAILRIKFNRSLALWAAIALLRCPLPGR